MSHLRREYRRALQWSVSSDDRFILALAVLVHLMAFFALGIDRAWPH